MAIYIDNEMTTPKGFNAVTNLTENLAVFTISDCLQISTLTRYFPRQWFHISSTLLCVERLLYSDARDQKTSLWWRSSARCVEKKSLPVSCSIIYWKYTCTCACVFTEIHPEKRFLLWKLFTTMISSVIFCQTLFIYIQFYMVWELLAAAEESGDSGSY